MAVLTRDIAIQAEISALARDDLHVFAQLAFDELKGELYMDNWHIAAVARKLERVEAGGPKRLIISMPPRTMKSDMASIFYPAWSLGRNPSAKIICASYGQKLSEDFAATMRTLMRSQTYAEIFPATKLDPGRNSVDEIATTKGGYRLSTSVGGVLTGRGADTIIIDDPLKASDAHSEAARASMHAWYRGTLLSRLNDPARGRIILVSQRLHQDDLAGVLNEEGDWDDLTLPLIEWRDREIETWPGTMKLRRAGEILHPERFPEPWIEKQRRDMGERDFEAQYNQRPLPPGGALFKRSWLQRYEKLLPLDHYEGIFQSWDTAYGTGDSHDYSACTTWGLLKGKYHLLHVYRDRLEFPALKKSVLSLRKTWRPWIVVVEGYGSGISLYQEIKSTIGGNWIRKLNGATSKVDRASQQTAKFERGDVLLPSNAEWLEEFQDELLAFPNGKHDDQVDSVVQFLAAVDTGNLLTGGNLHLSVRTLY